MGESQRTLADVGGIRIAAKATQGGCWHMLADVGGISLNQIPKLRVAGSRPVSRFDWVHHDYTKALVLSGSSCHCVRARRHARGRGRELSVPAPEMPLPAAQAAECACRGL